MLCHGAVVADEPDAAYAAIRGEGRLLELPVFRPDLHYGSVYLGYARRSPRERPQGYSTLAPPAADRLARELRGLSCGRGEIPAELGIRFVAVHRGLYAQSGFFAPDCADRAEAMLRSGGWRLLARDGPIATYAVLGTIPLALASFAIGLAIALLVALMRLSKVGLVSWLGRAYVSVIRGTPLLVQIYFIYLALPQVGIVLPAIPAGIIALSFNYGAYMSEVFRAGIQAVPRGQREAAQSLGMPERLLMTRIVLPQAFRIVIPAIGNDFVSMLKDSSLVSLLAVEELMFRSRLVGAQNFRSLEALIIAAAIYWILTIVFSYVQQRLENRMARGDR